MPFSDILALIPASGKGKRFGQPKHKALLNGKTFTDCIINTLKEAEMNNIVTGNRSCGNDYRTLIHKPRSGCADFMWRCSFAFCTNSYPDL